LHDKITEFGLAKSNYFTSFLLYFKVILNLAGWISRQQFEETWAALLGVLSSPLSPEQTSREV
jgi:hypothetical protein